MTTLPTYDAERLGDLLRVLPDVDAVEIKFTVPDVDRRPVLQELGIDSLDAEIRQVAFLDTPDLGLSAAGVVVRARRTQRKAGDVVVKLRPMLPVDVPDGLRRLAGFKLELDATPSGYTPSCSLSAEMPDRRIRQLLDGARTLPDLLTDEQHAVLAERLPNGIGIDDLQLLGPLHVLRCKFSPERYPRRMVAELWFLPDGSRLLELSAKCPPEEAFQTAAETKVLLAGHGIDLGAPQETKTRTALAALVADLTDETQE